MLYASDKDPESRLGHNNSIEKLEDMHTFYRIYTKLHTKLADKRRPPSFINYQTTKLYLNPKQKKIRHIKNAQKTAEHLLSATQTKSTPIFVLFLNWFFTILVYFPYFSLMEFGTLYFSIKISTCTYLLKIV